MLILSLIGQFVCLLGTMFLSARRTIRTKGRFEGIIKGALLLYGLTIAWSFAFSVVIPGLLIANGADTHVVANSFPEAIGNMPAVLFGWVPALIFAGLVRRIYDIKTVRVDPNAKS
jgi:hypothetical protein